MRAGTVCIGENMKWIYIIGMVCVLSACAATGQLYKDHSSTLPSLAPDTVRLIVFRTTGSLSYMGGKEAPVLVDGFLAGKCETGEFNVFEIPAGKHVLTIDIAGSPGSCDLQIDVSGGGSYYYEIKPRSGYLAAAFFGGLIGTAIESSGKKCGGPLSINPIEPGAALEKLKDLHKSEG